MKPKLNTPTGAVIPLLPKANPTGDNPNPWMLHTAAAPIHKLKRPIEVEFDGGVRKIMADPTLWEDVASNVKFWRWHHVPEKMEHYIRFVWHRSFTLKDRIRILFGKNIVVPIAVACRNSPGVVQPIAIGYVTESKDANEFMLNELKLASARFLKETAKEVKEAREEK